MKRHVFAVFLDTQVFEGASFNFQGKALGSKALDSLQFQVSQGHVRVILTDITVREVRARIEKTVRSQLDPLEKLKRQARVLRSSGLPEVKAALELDATTVIADLEGQFEDFLARTKVEVIDTSTLPLGDVFDRYFAGKPPFDTADKKNEFPDAFVVEALAKWANDNDVEPFVVSGDKGFRDAADRHQNLFPHEFLSHVLNLINDTLFDKAIAEFIREQTRERIKDIAEEVEQGFEANIYNVDDEWGDVEVQVNSLTPLGEPEILEFDHSSATVQVRFDGQFTAHLSYDDSTTGVYDSETKTWHGLERRHQEQEEEEEFVAEVKMKFEPFDPESVKIEDVNVIQPDDSYSISTNKI